MRDIEDLSILELLESLDVDEWETVIFRGEEGSGEVTGVLIGMTDLISAVAEGFETAEAETLVEALTEDFTKIGDDDDPIVH